MEEEALDAEGAVVVAVVEEEVVDLRRSSKIILLLQCSQIVFFPPYLVAPLRTRELWYVVRVSHGDVKEYCKLLESMITNQIVALKVCT